jgi:hypothetical protein
MEKIILYGRLNIEVILYIDEGDRNINLIIKEVEPTEFVILC